MHGLVEDLLLLAHADERDGRNINVDVDLDDIVLAEAERVHSLTLKVIADVKPARASGDPDAPYRVSSEIWSTMPSGTHTMAFDSNARPSVAMPGWSSRTTGRSTRGRSPTRCSDASSDWIRRAIEPSAAQAWACRSSLRSSRPTMAPSVSTIPPVGERVSSSSCP